MDVATRIFLVGPMGAGKSAVGRQLAQTLGYEFVDTDHEIEERTGVDIPFIFEKEGEAGFRKRETQVFEQLAGRDNIVVATGGGCVVTPRNRELMHASGRIVYLSASIDQLFERVRDGNQRPLLNNDNPKDVLEKLLAVRGPLYEHLADITINTDRRRVRAVAGEARRRLQNADDAPCQYAQH